MSARRTPRAVPPAPATVTTTSTRTRRTPDPLRVARAELLLQYLRGVAANASVFVDDLIYPAMARRGMTRTATDTALRDLAADSRIKIQPGRAQLIVVLVEQEAER
jgi:hypothetical protein